MKKAFLLSVLLLFIFSCEEEEDEGPNGWCPTIDAKAFYNDTEYDITVGYFMGEEDPENPDNSLKIGMLSECMQLRNSRIEGVEGMFVTFELIIEDGYFMTGQYSSEETDHMAVRNFKFVPFVTANPADYEVIEADFVNIEWINPHDSQIGLYEIDITANLKNGKVFIARYSEGFYEFYDELNL